MTLLFALFVVLFAISSVDQAKYRKVANSFEQAFGAVPNQGQGLMETNPGVPGPVNVIPPVMPHHAPMPPLQKEIANTERQIGNVAEQIVGLNNEVAAMAKAYRVYFAKAGNSGSSTDYLMDHSSIIYLMGPDGSFAVTPRTSNRLA